MTTAGIVLAGGGSTRMGSAKAALSWHGSTLLRRITELIGRVVAGPVVVVRAPEQDLPALAGWVEVAEDPVPGRGPLQGLAVGLGRLAGRAEAAFVCATDLPLLHPAFARRVLAELTDQAAADVDADRVDVVLPVAHGYQQPLAAAYRTGLAPLVADLVVAGRLRLTGLFEACAVARLPAEALLADPVLAAVDPGLDSVRNVNSPAEYRAALARPAPAVTVRCPGGQHGSRTVLAATVAEAAKAVGLSVGRQVVATLNGGPASDDGEVPLVVGDTVTFLAARLAPTKPALRPR